MRFVLLLLTGIIPGLSFSQRTHRPELLALHPYDTLNKYSFLVVSMQPDKKDRNKTIPLAYGTGCFVRNDQKLYFVTAAHVFTNCDIYKNTHRVDTPVAVKIWYKDTLGRRTQQLIFLSQPKRQTPCRSAVSVPDVDTMDVSAYFKNGEIYSIEGLMPDYHREFHNLSPHDTIVTYGYPNELNNPDTIDINPNLTPVGYISFGRKIPRDQPRRIVKQIADFYYAIEPGLPTGVSGAPLFRVSSDAAGKTIVEFIGVQSGTKENRKISLIAQGRILSSDYHLR